MILRLDFIIESFVMDGPSVCEIFYGYPTGKNVKAHHTVDTERCNFNDFYNLKN